MGSIRGRLYMWMANYCVLQAMYIGDLDLTSTILITSRSMLVFYTCDSCVLFFSHVPIFALLSFLRVSCMTGRIPLGDQALTMLFPLYLVLYHFSKSSSLTSIISSLKEWMTLFVTVCSVTSTWIFRSATDKENWKWYRRHKILSGILGTTLRFLSGKKITEEDA